jgi:ribose 5-phosphate isomerase B
MRKVITEGDIPLQGELRVAIGSIITPSARDAAQARGVRILELPPEQVSGIAPPEKTIALGSDHGGFRMKEALKPVLAELGFEVRDVGVHDETAADYPDIAEKAALLVAEGRAGRGVIVDGAGIGSAMAANKIPGIRAALCYDRASARNSREHNDANVLTLGGRLLTATQAEEVLRTWLATPFGGGRHAARLGKIAQIEQRYRNWTPGNSNNS